MRRTALLLAAMTLLGAGAVLAALALAPRSEPTAAERVQALAGQMRCPDCQSLSVAESRTRAAAAIRDEIAGQVAAGRSDDEIRTFFVDSYGEWILLAPPEPLVWWIPAAALLAGLAALALWFGAGRRRPERGGEAALPPVTKAERDHIADELEALDG